MSPSSPHDTNTSTLLCFLTGVAIAVMGYSLYSHVEELQRRPDYTRKRHVGPEVNKKLEDAIPLKALVYLIQSSNAAIQSNSVKITVERAMSGAHLPSIVAACQKEQPIELRSQALTALQLLTQKEHHRGTLLEAGALKVLVDALASTESEMKEMTQRYVAMAICDLIQGSDINKYCVIEMGILESIQRILTSTTIRNNELKYWTLMILHQISLSDPFPKVLVHQGFVGLLAKMARMTFGNTNMPKFCMQSLVRLVASVDTMESKIVLVELLDYNIVDLISVCLRGDDVELIYWAAGLMHEFVLKDVASNQFRAIKGIHTILAGLLSAEEMYISRVVLRTIKFMAYGDETFRQGMIKTDIVKKIMHCLAINDDDVRYWATLCVHAVASQVESHRDILTAPEFEFLLELALSKKVHAAIFVADILSLICCIWQNDLAIKKHLSSVVSTLNSLVTWHEVEVQYNSAGALFNLMAMQESFAYVIREECHATLFDTCVSSSHERVQLTCAKASLKLAIKYPSLKPKLISTVIEPLIDRCITANHQLLPILMMQNFAAANKSPQTTDPSNLSPRTAEEDILRTPEYINVSSNGVISSDRQLDRRVRGSGFDTTDTSNSTTSAYIPRQRQRRLQRQRLQERNDNNALLSRPSSPTPSSSSDTLSDSSSASSTYTTEIDPEDLVNNLSLLFQHTYAERVAILTQFELPSSIHNTLAGSLCVLRYFLENSPISGTIIDGASSTLLTAQNRQHEQLPRTTTPSRHQQQRKRSTASSLFSPLDDYYNEDDELIGYTSDQDNFYVINTGDGHDDDDDDDSDHNLVGASDEIGLADRPRYLVDGLVYQALFPVIALWWKCCHSPQETESMTMDDQLAWNAYKDVLLWVRNQACLATQQHDSSYLPYAQLLSMASPSSFGDNGGSSMANDGITLDDTMIPSIKLYNGFTSRSLLALRSLVRYESIRCYLIHKLHFVELMIFMFQRHPSLTDHVLTCLGVMVQSGNSLPENTLQRCVVVIWKYLLDPSMSQQSKKTFRFYTRLLLTCASRMKGDKTATDMVRGVELDLAKSTPFCLINQETSLEVRNDSWTFETVTCTHAAMKINVKGDNKVCYQVILKTDGLNQMGWINYQCRLDAEAGCGVGDDEYSYGYDGFRCKKWHGRHRMRKTNYGKTWKVGDVITCALDLDHGEIRYYQNGDDLGVAFTKVDPTQHWYPAVSLSTGQECEFLFGGPLDPLRDGPDGYQSIHEFHFSSPEEEEIQPQFMEDLGFLDNTTTENAELMEDLAEAMQRMRVSSPPSLTPSPSLGLLGAVSSLSGGVVTNSIPITQQQSTLHSLYVEMTVAYRPFKTPSVNMDTMMFGWKNALLSVSSTSLYLDYNHATKQGKICLDTLDLLPTSFTMHLSDGDLIGLFYDQQQNHFGFSLNGDLLALVRLDTPFLPYVPYTMGLVKTKTNYGQHDFQYGASSEEQRRSAMMYLGQMMLGED